MLEDTDFIDKLSMYKTAYSLDYDCYVRLDGIRAYPHGEIRPVMIAPGTKYREPVDAERLVRYCL